MRIERAGVENLPTDRYIPPPVMSYWHLMVIDACGEWPALALQVLGHTCDANTLQISAEPCTEITAISWVGQPQTEYTTHCWLGSLVQYPLVMVQFVI